MSIIDDIIMKIAEKRLGADFEQRVMQALENQSCSQDDVIDEITEHYQAIIQLLSPKHKTIKLDANDLLTIIIDGKEYNLDDKSTSKSRKAAEHRMAIEFLLSDFEQEAKKIIEQVEVRLNNN